MKSESLIPIVYEDDEIILIDKRSGLASQGGVGVGKSVDTELSAQIGQKVYLCHRLDKDTSGLLLCAKTSAAANKWSRLVGEKSVKKEYLALCFGQPKNPSGKITLPVKEKGQSKSAVTYYEKAQLSDFMQEEAKASRLDLCLMKLTLATGRTHQIRIHLAQSELPIVGDDKYGDFGLNKAAKRDLGLKRLCLCAFRLTLPLASGQQTFEISPDFPL
ncbi:MAG: RluA family pseudouridine synthase [Treponema sp.]|nr:RluA family pseudouridine synthase [Treponema sp.]MEE3434680.1 RluA family pseudouridine synthase [Treponema sp.]